MTRAAETLRKAADLIEQRGKAVGEYQGPGGSLCVKGAIWLAATGQEPTGDACWTPPTLDASNKYRFASITLHNWLAGTEPRWPGVVTWNDESAAEMVIAGLREAADADEERP